MNVFAKVAYILLALTVAVIVGALAGPGHERWIAFGVVTIMTAGAGGLIFRRIDRAWPPQGTGD